MSVRNRRDRRAAAAETQARYDAAGTGRRLRGWNAPSTGPRGAVEGLAKVRDRARDAGRNDWAGAAIPQKWSTALVGVGITPRWAKDKHAALWEDFLPQADAEDLCGDGYAVQALAARSWIADGEVFLRRRWRSLSNPLALPVQVQTIEADFCPVFDADQWPGMPEGNRIAQGRERNKWGRTVAWWFYGEHPGDATRGTLPSPGQLIRVPASEISHVYEVKRGGALRGVSELAPALARIRASSDLEDTVLDRQRLANLFAVFFRKPLPAQWSEVMVDPLTGLPKEWSRQGQEQVPLEPGISMDLAPGEEVTFSNPPEAGVSFSDYLRTLGLGTSASQGLPYELMTGDIREVSDRTLRIIIQEFRRYASQRQWHVLIPRVCRPMVEWVADAAILAGRLRPNERREFTRPEWSPHAWEYIHPVQDVQGKVLALKAGITSQRRLISERGDDPKTIYDEREQDAKDAAARGLPGAPSEPAGTQQQGDPSGSSGNGPQASALAAVSARIDALAAQRGPSQDVAALAGVMSGMVTQFAALAEAVMRIAERPVTVQAAIDVPAAKVDVHAMVEPTSVTVTVPAPEVHVAAPAVTVENTVPVPEVHVSLPDRQVETTVTLDADGQIVGSVAIERTLN